MPDYTVEKDLPAIVFPAQGLWAKNRAKIVKTRFTRTRGASEIDLGAAQRLIDSSGHRVRNPKV